MPFEYEFEYEHEEIRFRAAAHRRPLNPKFSVTYVLTAPHSVPFSILHSQFSIDYSASTIRS